MKVITKIYCNICKKLIFAGEEGNIPDYNFIISESSKKSYETKTYDLCDECTDDLIKYIEKRRCNYEFNRS